MNDDPLYDPLLEVVLFQPEIPHNAGAVGRTCVAVGARLWLVHPLGFRLDNRYLKRSGLDYWPHLMWETAADWNDLTIKLNEQSPDGKPRRYWFLSKKAEHEYTNVQYQKGDVLVFGCESQGLPDTLLEANANRTLRIPIREQTRSLNLSVSAGIVIYEARRQIAAD